MSFFRTLHPAGKLVGGDMVWLKEEQTSLLLRPSLLAWFPMASLVAVLPGG